MNNIINKIRDSSVFERQVSILDKKGIEYKELHGHNWIKLTTEHHNYLFYVNRFNVNHIFFTKIFNKDTIQQRLVAKTSKNITDKVWYDRDINVHRDEKIVTYRNTDIGTTNNTNNTERVTETLGHPFKREIIYKVRFDTKDRLQYTSNRIELHSLDKDKKRKKILDDVFCSRVYRLLLNYEGLNSNDINHIFAKEKYISGTETLKILRYLYSVMKSYHPYFYKLNGTSKYNMEWFKKIIFNIEEYGLIDYPHYKLTKVNRQKNTHKYEIKQKDILEWRKQNQALLDKGEGWVDIE
jgi:hypothetical protein